MYLGFFTLSFYIASCYCYVAYEMFRGFDAAPGNTSSQGLDAAPGNTSSQGLDAAPVNTSSQGLDAAPGNTSSQGLDAAPGSTSSQGLDAAPGNTSSSHTTIFTISKITSTMETLGTTSLVPVTLTTVSTTTTTPVPPVTSSKFECPEEDQPSNIGAYEVPTHRDVVLLVRNTLTTMFNRYHEKALYFLKDIKEAAKATLPLERKCHSYADRAEYKKCVKQVSLKCELITKVMVTSLQRQRLDVEAFTNGTVCNVKDMKADPIELVKSLAMEEASLEFALPGYLRLLSACSIYCDRMKPQHNLAKKPLRHMTDQDLVIKHFLTKKSYIQLIKGSK